MTMNAPALQELRRKSPITQARARAYEIMVTHNGCIRDQAILDDFIEDIAQAIVKGVTVSHGEQDRGSNVSEG